MLSSRVTLVAFSLAGGWQETAWWCVCVCVGGGGGTVVYQFWGSGQIDNNYDKFRNVVSSKIYK